MIGLTRKKEGMKVWLLSGVIIFYVLGYYFLRERMRRDIVKLFKAYMLLMIFLLSLLSEPFMFTNDLTPRARYPKGHENYKKTLIKEGAIYK